MTRTFLPLPDSATLDAAIERSATQPIVIFKHSPTCGISAQAEEDLRDWLAREPAPAPVYVVRVREHREVSNAIATRFGVRHESPQLLLIDNHQLRWHGSHFHVNARELSSALDRVAEPVAANGR